MVALQWFVTIFAAHLAVQARLSLKEFYLCLLRQLMRKDLVVPVAPI